MTLLYTIAGLYSKKNPIEVIRHYGPAYLTSIGTMSSAATLAVALQCAGKSKDFEKGHGLILEFLCLQIYIYAALC